jgi:hypothetical protein
MRGRSALGLKSCFFRLFATWVGHLHRTSFRLYPPYQQAFQNRFSFNGGVLCLPNSVVGGRQQQRRSETKAHEKNYLKITRFESCSNDSVQCRGKPPEVSFEQCLFRSSLLGCCKLWTHTKYCISAAIFACFACNWHIHIIDSLKSNLNTLR